MKPRNFQSPLLVVLIVLAGCSAPTQKTDMNGANAPRQPDLTLQVASLNMNGLSKRLEKRDIERFSKLLKKEQIVVLAVQGITRYPGVETRVDFVTELAAQTEMRQTFGEMVNISGRQSGNGIFSSYPMRNIHNEPFDGVKSAMFEAALELSVDGGVKDIVVVSTLLPHKASENDQSACLKLISSKSVAGPNLPLIVAGNLPSSESVRALGPYEDVVESVGTTKGGDLPTRIWFTNGASLKLLNARTVETDFGTMLVAQFGLFR